jgi:hypothetical protein
MYNFFCMSVTGGKAFGQFSSNKTQRPKTLEPTKIQLDIQEDMQGNEHLISFEKCEVTIEKTGMYLIIVGAQVGRERTSPDSWIDFWLRINGIDVPNSNIRFSSVNHDQKDVAMTQCVTHLGKTDHLNLMMSVSNLDDGLGIEAIQPEGEPMIPSVILTILQLQ